MPPFSCSSFFPLTAALEDAVETLSSGGSIELPLVRPQLTLLQDYSQPLERFDNYEDDEGELRAESNLAEKFGELPLRLLIIINGKSASDYFAPMKLFNSDGRSTLHNGG